MDEIDESRDGIIERMEWIRYTAVLDEGTGKFTLDTCQARQVLSVAASLAGSSIKREKQKVFSCGNLKMTKPIKQKQTHGHI